MPNLPVAGCAIVQYSMPCRGIEPRRGSRFRLAVCSLSLVAMLMTHRDLSSSVGLRDVDARMIRIAHLQPARPRETVRP